jgi:dTDP-4-dehydrorhamnose 3,5-epimerase-like enzyme
MKAKLTQCKEIITYDKNGRENGSIIELLKDGQKTTLFITTIKPGVFKGYHIHKRRTNRFVCIKGSLELFVYNPNDQKELKLGMDAEYPEVLTIPPRLAIGIENQGIVDGWLLNFPDPPYDPEDKDEQENYYRKKGYRPR